MDKNQVAQILINIATLLDLKGENPFKSRAYQNAARALETLEEPLEKVIKEERLAAVKGIGESIAQKILDLVSTGKLAYYEELKAATPPGLVLMLEIPGLGPKKIKALHTELGIETVEQLEQACKEGKVAKLKGFGEKTQINICDGINRRRSYASRHLISDASGSFGKFIRSFAQPSRRHSVQHRRKFTSASAKLLEILTYWPSKSQPMSLNTSPSNQGF